MSDVPDLDARRATYDATAEDYVEHRPGYPADAIRWVVGCEPKVVVDLGCGPGNLTAPLAALGHTAIGIDPSLAMLRAMKTKHPLRIVGRAEAIPLRNEIADVVTAATAFHWFDHDVTVPEMRRVLRAGGRVGIFTNIRDETVAWVRALSEIIGSEAAMAATIGQGEGMEVEFVAKLEKGGLFESVQHRIFDWQQELTPEGLVGLVRSRSYVAALEVEERRRLIEGVRGLCAQHQDLKGRESFTLTYESHAFRAVAA